MQRRFFCLSLLIVGLLIATGVPAAAQTIATVKVSPDGVEWLPQAQEYDGLMLTVTGPGAYCFIKSYEPGDSPRIDLFDENGKRILDGSYTWELTLDPTIDAATRKDMLEVRKIGDPKLQDKFAFERLPARQIDSGFLRVRKGFFVIPEGEEESKKRVTERPGAAGSAAAGTDLAGGAVGGDARPGITPRDFVINDDLIVDGSACIGFDCVNGEVFSFDTIRLKENNLRIKFDDTSVAASFPRNDWQLTANESANGGASKFSIEDISGGRTPFTVEANAPSHSLYVDDGGRIGMGTSTPSVEIHTIDGDTPTLRLQQDGSSGFEPQTWDVAGNETNFFVRDVTNGSALPFRIRPGAPTSSIFIDIDGDVGLGTSSPADFLDVQISGANGGVRIESTTDGTLPQLTLVEPSGTWRFRVNNGGNFVFTDVGTGNSPFQVFGGADAALLVVGGNTTPSAVNNRVTVNGELFVGGTQLSVPDYVFEEDYPLMPLAELRSFISTNGHLPNVKSAGDVERQGGINLTQMPLTLLEKVEELTLYVLALDERNAALETELEALRAQIGSQP